MRDISSTRSPSPPPPPPPPIPRQRSPSPPQAYKVVFSLAPDALPDPLPSIEAIESAPTITDLFSRHTALVDSSYVVKFGTGVYRLEAETMRFVRQARPDIRIPQVHAMYERRHPEYPNIITNIIMEKIKGETLQSKWRNLNKDEKLGFAQQLRSCLDSLRTIPHEGLFARLNKTALQDCMFTSTEPYYR
ncbi:hypothetical protein PWT90_02779 [Aphanocladium album]|nr:hypothetical protein PWT90_02779 [Aphanocladium album]